MQLIDVHMKGVVGEWKEEWYTGSNSAEQLSEGQQVPGTIPEASEVTCV